MSEIYFTIIVPVYNCERTIARCLESIILQTYTSFEVYIIDDGSTDSSGRICDEYALKDFRLKVIHKENEGVSSARRLGIEKSAGEYICFIDSDDEFEINFLKEVQNKIIDSRCEMIIFGFNKIFTQNGNLINSEIVNCERKIWKNKNEIKSNIITLFPNMIIAPLWNKVYKKELLINENMIEMRTGEDYIFNLQIIEKVNCIYIIDDILYKYYRPIDEISRVNIKSIDFINDFIFMHQETYKLFFYEWGMNSKCIERVIDTMMYGLYQIIIFDKIHDIYYEDRIKEYLKNEWILKSIKNSENFTKKEQIYKWLLKKRFIKIIRNIC